MSPDFRWRAKQSLTRAQEEMASGLEPRLRYAALELREAMEALVYERALAFKDDISPEQYKTWQPRKLMGLLLQIDPTVDLAITLSIGLQPAPDKPAPEEAMRVLGTNTPLSLQNLKDHYDALGSFLHMPSIEQVTSGKIADLSKLRAHCESLVAILEKILSSQIWNTTIGRYTTIPECANNKCKQPIRRRLPDDKTEIETRCFACNATYQIKYGHDNEKIEWVAKVKSVQCENDGCAGEIHLWPDEIKAGTWWNCPDCGSVNKIVLRVVVESQEAE